MLQSRSQRLLYGKKVVNIGPFLTNFSHKLEHHFRTTSLFTQKCMQKDDNAFCFTARYFYINYSKHVIAPLS